MPEACGMGGKRAERGAGCASRSPCFFCEFGISKKVAEPAHMHPLTNIAVGVTTAANTHLNYKHHIPRISAGLQDSNAQGEGEKT